MVKISDISVETQILFCGFSYIVVSVGEDSFVAKSFLNGKDRTFTEKDLPNVKIKSPYTCGCFVAVTSEGIPIISPDDPKRDGLRRRRRSGPRGVRSEPLRRVLYDKAAIAVVVNILIPTSPRGRFFILI